MAIRDIAYIGARPRRTKPQPINEALFEEQAKVIARAQALFAKADAYGVLRKALPGTVEIDSRGLTLRAVLQRLSISPLNADSVRRYKASKTRTWIEKSSGIKAWYYTFWCSLTFFVYMLVSNWHGMVTGQQHVPYGLLALTGLLTAISGAGAFAGDFGTRWKCETFWVRDHIESFGLDNVPLFVLDTAVKVKEAVPECTLYAEELRLNRRELPKPIPVHVADPFLIAKLGPEEVLCRVLGRIRFRAEDLNNLITLIR